MPLVAVHEVHSVLLAVVLGGGCQWNLSWTAVVLSLVRHVATYSGALQEDLFVGLASSGRFTWNVLSAHWSVDPTSNVH